MFNHSIIEFILILALYWVTFYKLREALKMLGSSLGKNIMIRMEMMKLEKPWENKSVDGWIVICYVIKARWVPADAREIARPLARFLSQSEVATDYSYIYLI